MRFTKMQGLGNDYIYVWGEVDSPEELSVRLSDRHFGIGGDGLILMDRSDVADFKMRIFNADGSEAKMCGNGIRCVGKYVFEKGYTDKKEITVETLSGIKTLQLEIETGKVKNITVQMGQTKVGSEMTLDIDGTEVSCVPVSVGNPHAVTFVEDMDKVDLSAIGPKLEKHPAFPDGINAEFVQVIDEHTLRMRVWERGSGITLACGTGACASAAAAVIQGLCIANTPISVQLDGGILQIKIASDGTAQMRGPARIVFEGEID